MLTLILLIFYNVTCKNKLHSQKKILAINIPFFFQLIAILIVFIMGTSFRNLKNASHALRPSES